VKRGVIATDRLTLLFVAAIAAAVLLRSAGASSWPYHLAALALTVGLLALLREAPADSPFMRFLGPVYPIILAAAFYTAIGTLNQDAGINHDLWAQRMDQALFGSQVSVTWHHAWPNPLLSWILHTCYVLYYPIVAVAALWHWRRTPRAVFERAVFLIALGFYVCFLVYVTYPVTGPRYFFGTATGAAADVLPARIVHNLLEGGSAYGTAFPSSHICVSWCAVLATWRSSRKLAVALGIPALGLALGTVYGQFHYGVDAVAGAALAWLLLAAADPLARALGANRPATAPAAPAAPRSP